MGWIRMPMFMWRQLSITTAVCWGSDHSMPTGPAMRTWLVGWPVSVLITRIGVEGTGSYGVGLARFLDDRGD